MPDYVVYVALLVISIAYNEIVAADADDNGIVLTPPISWPADSSTSSEPPISSMASTSTWFICSCVASLPVCP